MTSVTPRVLVSAVTCPHCWHEFPPAQVRFLSEHESLRGDPVLGPGEALRFHPSRFDARCRPVDPFGVVCSRMACPRCHLELPAAFLEMPSTIISVVGAPGCGKSVMLAATSFSLRSGLVVPNLEFIDADPELNDLTFELESTLFRSSSPDRPAMIAKTDLSGRLYRSFRLADSSWTAPKPQIFLIGRSGARRVLCLYDNAGEHFLPGRDTAREPVTRHLAASKSMIFVVDPTQDHRMVARLGGREAVSARGGGGSVEQRQDLVLIEAANRVRRLRSLSVNDPLPFRVVLALAKADIWGGLVEPRLDASFGRLSGEGGVVRPMAVPGAAILDRAHRACCTMLSETMPELIATVRTIDPGFRVVPFSGLGRSPSPNPLGPGLAIRPSDVDPIWPAAPVVVALAESERAMFPEYHETGGAPVGSGGP